MEEVKKKKEVIKKTGGDDQPDWQDVSVNLEWTTRSINLVKSPHDENRIARQILKLIYYFLIYRISVRGKIDGENKVKKPCNVLLKLKELK